MATVHRVVNIGGLISDKELKRLEKLLDSQAREGYELAEIFQVHQPSGCLGLGKPVLSNLAVFTKEEEISDPR